MHAAVGVLTERGGMTSHAAVIGRGMGLPCVVGAPRDAVSDARRKQLTTADGRVLREGDMDHLDGTSAARCWPAPPPLLEAALDDAFPR
jgi:pyruvate,orthophosphate dikinase